MQVTVNSANINTFRVGVQFDIYNKKVTFQDLSTYAGSSGSGINNVQGISFLLQDQAGVELAVIDFGDPANFIVPNVTREFELDLSQLSLPFLFQSYKIQAVIKDQDGSLYYTPETFKKVGQPAGLTESGYVPALFQLSANCVDNIITVKDLTPYLYHNSAPVITSKTGNLYYPTGTIDYIPFSGTPFSNNVIYTGEYRINCTSISEYDLQDDVSVLVTYIANNVYNVTCADKIADLICCMVDLQNTYLKNCNNAVGQNAKQKLEDVMVPFMLGLTKEINGQDASAEAELIRKTLNCDCGSTSLRQNEFTPINPYVNQVAFQQAGGTTVGVPSINGTTKTYPISSNIYQIQKGDTGDLAYTITVDTSTQYFVKYIITFNYNEMATSILNAISVDPTLINLFNSLVNSVSDISIAGLDGKCVIDLTSCDYIFTKQFFTNNAYVSSILIDGNVYTAPGGLIASTPAAIQSWLNGIGAGTWTVQYFANGTPPGGTILIQSAGNTSLIGTITFSVDSADYAYSFLSTCKTLVDVLQAIVDYLCNLTAAQVNLGATLTLWQLDYNGQKVSSSYTSQEGQGAYNQAVADSIYNIVNWISSLTGITCAKIKAIFADAPSVAFGSDDRIYGTLGGNCAAINDKQIAQLVIAALNKYSDVKAAFCAISCATPGSCPDISAVNISVVGGSIGLYGVTFSSSTSQTQLVTVMYKLSSSGTWITANSALLLAPNGNVQGTSPYTFGTGASGATYDVKVINNCGGAGFTTQISFPNTTGYPGTYTYGNILYLLCGGATTTLYTPVVFAVGTTVYTDPGMTVPLTGSSYIFGSDGKIYQLNPSTGVVLADTGSVCNVGTPVLVLLGNSTGSICSGTIVTRYVNGSFATSGGLYMDSALTTPVTGSAYVVNTATGKIYNLNSSTGVIGADTGLSCTVYTKGVRLYVSNSDLICSAGVTTVYSGSPYGTGATLYTDAGLTVPVAGYGYVVSDGTDGDVAIHYINNVTGLVGTETGDFCTLP